MCGASSRGNTWWLKLRFAASAYYAILNESTATVATHVVLAPANKPLMSLSAFSPPL